jgi:hypothetical protein
VVNKSLILTAAYGTKICGCLLPADWNSGKCYAACCYVEWSELRET